MARYPLCYLTMHRAIALVSLTDGQRGGGERLTSRGGGEHLLALARFMTSPGYDPRLLCVARMHNNDLSPSPSLSLPLSLTRPPPQMRLRASERE